ncbi:Ig-like domain-containing protein [Patescibacteria group bacterium]|nr:Ig-like domain-containing protein [Patescibacteria group bacterium]
MIFHQQKKFFFLVALLLVLGIFLVPSFVSAQDLSLGIEYGSALNLGSRDLRDIIAAIVNVVLGFLGVVAVLICLYGGFTWMTAGGSPDKIEKAKKILINGAIGLIIILSAFAIVNFLVKALGDATMPGAACVNGQVEVCGSQGNCDLRRECANGQWGSCNILYPLQPPGCDYTLGDNFILASSAPSPDQQLPIRNVVVKLEFNHQVTDLNLIPPPPNVNGVTIIQRQNGVYDPANEIFLVGAHSSNLAWAEIKPDNSYPQYECPGYPPGQYPELACFPYDSVIDDNNWYQVTVESDSAYSFQDQNGNTVDCSLGAPCTFEFKVGPLIDLLPPTVDLTEAEDSLFNLYPWTGNNINLSDDDEFVLRSLASDDVGLATIDFFEQEGGFYLGALVQPGGAGQFAGESDSPWSTVGYQSGEVYHLGSEVTDYANNAAQSVKQVTLYPGHCFDNICNEDESCTTDPAKPADCGGSCPACAGESCSADPDMCLPENTVCVSNVCIPANQPEECTCYPLPLIQDISPLDGAPGNFVTISGQGFGATPGEVYFVDKDPGGLSYPAQLPDSVNPACSDNWKDTQVIVVVPNISQNTNGYYIELGAVNPYAPPAYLTETTNNNYGPVLTFTQSGLQRPGLCLVTPAIGQFEDGFVLDGNNLNIGLPQSIEFGSPPNNIPANNQNFLSGIQAQGTVPNLSQGQVPVLVIVNSLESNPLVFAVQPSGYGGQPFITNFIPASGPAGQYVTIYGGNFGTYIAGQSSVEFNNIPVDFDDFPAECGTDFWHDNFIVVKVPDDQLMTIGPITVIREDGERATSSDDFNYDPNAPLFPGICSLYPQEGYEGDPVEIVGEYFEDSWVNFSTQFLNNPSFYTNINLGGVGEADIFELTVPVGASTGEVLVQRNYTGGAGDPCINNNQCQQNLYCLIPGGLTQGTCQPIASGSWSFIVKEGELTFTGNFGYYQWQFETCADCYVPQVLENGNCNNQQASPTPPPEPLLGYNAAYVNQVLGVRFNTDMADTSFAYNYIGSPNPTYIIQRCNGDSTQENLPFVEAVCGPLASGNHAAGYPFYDNNSQEYVEVRPQNDFLPGFWYRVILTNGLISEAEGYPMENNLNFNYFGGSMNDSFEWHFRTRLTEEACTPDTVLVNPRYRLENPPWPDTPDPIERDDQVNYSGSCQDSGVCAICPDTFLWDWQSEETINGSSQSPATKYTLITAPVDDDRYAYITADDLLRFPDLGSLTAEITHYQTGNPPQFEPLLTPLVGTAELNIVPPSPYIEFDNSCDESVPLYPSPNPYSGSTNVCRNAIIQARFVNNQGLPIDMDITTLTDANIIVEDQDSNQVLGQLTANLNGFTFTPNPVLYLAADSAYTVTLNNVYSLEQMPLAGPNSWSFETGDEVCDEVSSLQIFPAYKKFVIIPEAENYIANLAGEQCILLSLPVNNWSWSSADPSVALIAGSINQYETVTSAGDGQTNINAAALIGSNSYIGSGLVEVVTDSGGPLEPLLITDHQPQSPPPVCLNAIIKIDFSESIKAGVNDPPQFPDAVTEAGSGALVSGQWIVSGGGSRYEFIPNDYLTANSAYQAYVKGGSGGIESVYGSKHLGQNECVNSGLSWSAASEQCYWSFNTGAELCAVENIYINVLDIPTSSQAVIFEDETVGWQATAYAANSNPLSNEMDDWQAEKPEVANLTAYTSPPYNNDRFRYAVGAIPRTVYGTTTVATDITATINEVMSQGEVIQEHVTSTPAQLTVEPKLKGPSVIQTEPVDGSQNICLNSLLSVKFNKHLDEQTVSSDTFTVNYNTPDPFSEEDNILTFDGTNDYLMIAAAGSANLNPGLEDFMVEAWVKITGLGERVIIGKKGYANSESGWRLKRSVTGKLYFSLADGGDGVSQTGSDLSLNEWHHLVAVADKDDTFKLYLDGELDAESANLAGLEGIVNDYDAKIGRGEVAEGSFAGSIAAVRFYKFGVNALPANIEDLIDFNYRYPNSVSPDLSSYAAGLWELDDGQGTVATDSSSYGHDMEFVSFPTWGADNLPKVANCSAVAYNYNKNNNQKKNFIFDALLARFINSFAGQLFNSIYNFVWPRAQAQPVYTGYWCPLDEYGEWAMENGPLYSTVKFNLNQFLPADSPVQVKVKGGAAGIKSAAGWPLENSNEGDDFVYSFETGSAYCELDFVTVATDDFGLSDEWLFLTPEDDETDNVTEPGNSNFDSVYDSDKVYYAHGYNSDGQELARVAGLPPAGYYWSWSWTSADPAIAGILYNDNEQSYSIVGAQNNSGETAITLTAEFLSVYQTNNLTADGKAIVDLCENPWPERELGNIEAPKYIDDDYSFALRYCRDAGGSGVSDDLPALDESQFIEGEFISSYLSNNPLADELLREYLIPVPTTGDVIGLRIYENAFHLTPLSWYQQNIENQGSPFTQTIDGYPAIQDGRTTYVGAANGIPDDIGYCTNLSQSYTCTQTYSPPDCGDCIFGDDHYYTNIYLLSYNQNTAPETMEIINQLLESWEFNTDINNSQDKQKVIRDMNRLVALSAVANALDNYQANHSGSYPALLAGTFVPGMSTSKWPSWNQALAPELGIGMPADPLNIFNSCIECQEPTLINGGFEEAAPLTGWTAEASVTAVINTEPQFIHEGNQSALVSAPALDAGIYSDVVSLIPNTTYELSAWVYLEAPNRAKLTFANANYGDNYGNQWFTPPDFTGWFQLKNRLITPSENIEPAPVVRIYLHSFTGQAAFYVDEAVLQTAGGNCGYDPETCWNPEANGGQGGFACDEGSYFYAYQNLASFDYQLSAKMEETINWLPANMASIEYIDSHIDLSLTNVAVCTSQVLAGVCGDGFVFPPEQCEIGMSYAYCAPGHNWYNPGAVGCDQLSCQWLSFANAPGCSGMTINQCCGGYCGDGVLNTSSLYNVSVDEECDYNAQAPNSGFANGQPQYSSAGSQYFCSGNCQESGGWCGNGSLNTPWEGCDISAPSGNQGFGGGAASYDQYACGAPNSGAASCQDIGGWCGDTTMQTPYGEECDKGAVSGAGWAHGLPSDSTEEEQYQCAASCQDTGGWCGDQIIQANYEDCDGNTGLLGWSCTSQNYGPIQCGSTPQLFACERICDSGCPYQGQCGNNITEGTASCAEVCDGTSTPPHTNCHPDCSSFICETGWLDCNANSGDGCEVNPDINIFNCGGCYGAGGQVCNYAGGHGAPVCNSGSCEIHCDDGYHCSSSSYPDYEQICSVTDDICEINSICGDGVINPGEVCDDGIYNGQVGFCNADCTAIEGLGTPIFTDDFEDQTFTDEHWEIGYAGSGDDGSVTWQNVLDPDDPNNMVLESVDTGSGWYIRDYRVKTTYVNQANVSILTLIDFGNTPGEPGAFDNWDAMVLARRNPNFSSEDQEYYAWWNDFYLGAGSPTYPVTCPGYSGSEPTQTQIRRTNIGEKGIEGDDLGWDNAINCSKWWVLFDIKTINGQVSIKTRWWLYGTVMPTIWNIEAVDDSSDKILSAGQVGLGNWANTTFRYDLFQVYDSQQ